MNAPEFAVTIQSQTLPLSNFQTDRHYYVMLHFCNILNIYKIMELILLQEMQKSVIQ